jgi:hypothetical protein
MINIFVMQKEYVKKLYNLLGTSNGKCLCNINYFGYDCDINNLYFNNYSSKISNFILIIFLIIFI